MDATATLSTSGPTAVQPLGRLSVPHVHASPISPPTTWRPATSYCTVLPATWFTKGGPRGRTA